MGLRFFVVPVHDPGVLEQELNGFLAGHKVVSIDRHLIDEGSNSFWAICVDYLSHASGTPLHHSNVSRSRVNYKTILTAEEFVVFSRLRELRKELAQTEAVPVCRTANRNTNDPTNRTNNNGFRLALNSFGMALIVLRLQKEQIVFRSEQVRT